MIVIDLISTFVERRQRWHYKHRFNRYYPSTNVSRINFYEIIYNIVTSVFEEKNDHRRFISQFFYWDKNDIVTAANNYVYISHAKEDNGWYQYYKNCYNSTRLGWLIMLHRLQKGVDGVSQVCTVRDDLGDVEGQQLLIAGIHGRRCRGWHLNRGIVRLGH